MKETSIWKTTIGRLRVAGFVEGISCIVLFGVAMPLKYFAGIPAAVKIPGWVHGVLFIIYLLALLQVTIVRRWPLSKVFIAFIASLIPCGTFFMDSRLKKEQLSILNVEETAKIKEAVGRTY
jgi:integral membrane protein